MTLPEFSLPGYERLLQGLQDAGHELLPVEDMPRRAGDGSRVVFLRHDIDAHLTGVTRLAEIEEGLGVRSTWMVATGLHYNPGSEPNVDIITRLFDRGHRIGLHYRQESVTAIADEKTHLGWCGCAVTSCCAHQPARLPIPQGEADFIDRQMVDLVHPHHPDFAGITYVSDSRRQWRDDTIARLLNREGPAQAHLNLHPEHWLGPPGETRHQAIARITAAMLADTASAAREIRDGWHLP